MNYHKIYERLINRARGRVLTYYTEEHHATPRSRGGSNDPMNLVNLTPEEHYVAHQLLVKLYPNHTGLITAAFLMTTGSPGRTKNKTYGWLRRRYSQAISGDGNPNRKYPEIAKQAGEKRRGQKRTAETRARMSTAQKGRTFTAETKTKMSKAANQKPAVSDETRAKLRDAQARLRSSGHKGPWAGKTMSPQTREKMSMTQRTVQRRDWNAPSSNKRAWAKANELRDIYMTTSVAKATRLVGLSTTDTSTIKRIIAKLKEGWVPLNDQSWLEFIKQL